MRPVNHHHHHPVALLQRDERLGPLSADATTTTDSTIPEECDIEMLETAITSTFAEGTPENEIILTWEPDLAADIRETLKKHTAETDRPYMIAVIGNPGR